MAILAVNAGSSTVKLSLIGDDDRVVVARELPAAACTYALPARRREPWGLRRHGFHGLSHSRVAQRAPELLSTGDRHRRIVSCHLGAGASPCAIRDGESVDTTMGRQARLALDR